MSAVNELLMLQLVQLTARNEEYEVEMATKRDNEQPDKL